MSAFTNYRDLPTHNFRTEIPNLILDAQLDPYDFILYCMIKRVAGDMGGCWLSNKKMAERCHMSERKFIYSKKNLEKKNLIKITKRYKADGSPDSDLIEIVDIWVDNHNHFKEKFIMSKSDRGGTAPHAGGVVHNMQEGGAPHADKEEPIEEDPFKEKENIQKKPEKPKKEPLASEDARKLANSLFISIKKIRENFKDPNISSWAIEIDKMLKIDKRSIEEIQTIILWLPSNKFWISKCLCGAKLRKHFDALCIEKDASLEKKNKHQEFSWKVKKHLNHDNLVIYKTGIYDKDDKYELSFNMPYEDFCRLLAGHYEIRNYEGDM